MLSVFFDKNHSLNYDKKAINKYMKNEKFEKILISLGLTKSETVVYFLLLQKGFKSIP